MNSKTKLLIGLTYDLKDEYLKLGFTEEEASEFDNIEVIDAIEKSLIELNYNVERIGNIFNLVSCLAQNKKYDLVFNIAEGYYGSAREAQIPCLLDAYNIPYVFSDALALAICHNKTLAKEFVRKHNILTPDFLEIKNIKDLNNLKLKYPLFAKPVAEGTSKGICSKSKVLNFNDLKKITEELLKKYKQPVLLETYLPGKEFTVGLVGNNDDIKVLGVLEVLVNSNAEQDIYSYINKKQYQDNITYRINNTSLAKACSNMAIEIYKILNCRDAARVDIRCDNNDTPYFLEVNPLAGLNPIDSDLSIMNRLQGEEYISLISNIMDAAVKRTGLL